MMMTHKIPKSRIPKDIGKFFRNNNVHESVSQRLMDSGLNTMQILLAINFDHQDWDEIATEIGLNPIEKLQLKSIILPLQKLPVIITKEETKAVEIMQDKTKDLKATMSLIGIIKREIDLQVNEYTKKIQSRFNTFHSLLNQREILLTEKLNNIGIKKKDKLQTISNALNMLAVECEQQADVSSKSLIEPIQVSQVSTRRTRILKRAKDIDDIKIILPSDPKMTNNIITVTLHEKLIFDAIHSFGTVTGDPIPIAIALVNKNDDNSVDMVDMVDMVDINLDNIDLDDDDDDDDILHQCNNNIIADSFCLTASGSSSSILLTGNSVLLRGNSQESFYLNNIISSGVKRWKFRIDKYTSGNQMIGIWNTKYKLLNNKKSTFLWDNKVFDDQLYGFAFNSSDPHMHYHWIYNGHLRKKYGTHIKNGDVIEMILDLNLLCITFIINNKDYGRASYIADSQYRGAVTLNTNGTQFTLL